MPATGVRPPPPGPNRAPTGSDTVVLAIDRLFLGDTNPDGTPNTANGWRNYGYDLDDRVSTGTSTDLCRPRNGASPSNVYPDGSGGRDNSFGKNILPIFLGLSSDFSARVNDAIAMGTLSPVIVALPQLDGAADINPIAARLYQGAAMETAPRWDGTDMWPVVPELLTDPTNIESSRLALPTSYVAGNVWVSAPMPAPITLPIPLGDSSFLQLPITITRPIITMRLNADRTAATEGMIAGILDTAALVDAVRRSAGAFDPSLCSGATIDSLVAQLEQASDILADGTQDPTRQCDGISIGLGFTARRIQLGPIAPATEPPPDPCAM